MATQKNLSWSYEKIQQDVSNTSAYVASVLSQTEGVRFEAYTLTQDNKGTFLSQMAKSAIYSLIPFFNRTISDRAQITESSGAIGFEFTPRISGGAYSDIDYTYVEELSRQHIVNYILKEWYAIKGVTAMTNYFISNLAGIDKQLDEMLVRFVRPMRRRSLNIRTVEFADREKVETNVSDKEDVDFDYSNLCVGSNLKLYFRMSEEEGVKLSDGDCDFELKYYTRSIEECVTIKKENAVKESDNKYTFVVATRDLSEGALRCLATVTSAKLGTTIIKEIITGITLAPLPL